MIPRHRLFHQHSKRQTKAFSYPLFFIAILHFVIFTIGVCEPSLQASFLVRETNNFNSYNTQRLVQQQNLFPAALYLQLATISSQLRLLHHLPTISQVSAAQTPHLQLHQTLSDSQVETNLYQILAGQADDSEAAANAEATINC